MQKIETQFGVIYMEDIHDREETDRIKIYDSKQKYIDYYSMELIEDIAERRQITAEAVLQDEIGQIMKCDDIECLITLLNPEWEMFTDDWTDVAEHLEIYDADPHRMLHEILNNDWVNIIGKYYIVIAE